MIRLRGIIVAAIVGGLLLSFASFAPVSAAGTIGGRPALPREDEPRSQSIFIHTLKNGETAADKLLVSNSSDKEQTISLYSVDAIPSNTGAFTCKQKAEQVADAGSWVSLSRQEVTLQPGKSDIVDFAITAPEKADVGEHNACIVFETKDDTGEVSGNLRIRTRSAIRVALTIPGDLHRKVVIDSYDIKIDNYRQLYNLKLRNSGNVSSDTDVEVVLKSFFGETVYRNKGQYPVLPGNKMELSFENTKSPFFGGWYVAQATVSYDKNATKWGTQSAGSLEKIAAKEQVIYIMPHPVAMIIILAVITAIAWAVAYWFIQRRRDQLILSTWRVHRVKEGETIELLAKATDTDWKRIAKANGIKPPYVLKVGKVIRLPKVTAKKNSAKD